MCGERFLPQGQSDCGAASLRGCAVSILRGFKEQLYQALRIPV